MKREQHTSTTQFFNFFRKSVAQRKGRIVIASVSVTLAVSIVTGILAITVGIGEKLGSELKAYGANAIVVPSERETLDYKIIENISNIDHVEEASGQIFGRALLKNESVEVIGVDVEKLQKRGWRLYGGWPEEDNEVLAGISLRDAFGLERGKSFSLQGERERGDFVLSGFIERGGTEDRAVIMSIQNAWELTGLFGKLNALLLRGNPNNLEGIRADIESAYPGTSVKTVRQVALAERNFLGKIQLLMIMVTVIVLFASGISVASTMGADVLERREEIGLMKAIGATRRQIGLFFFAETVFIGLSGGILGCIIGYSAAQGISQGAFDSFIPFSVSIPPVSLIAGLVLAILAGYFPVRDAMKYNPAEVLRGE